MEMWDFSGWGGKKGTKAWVFEFVGPWVTNYAGGLEEKQKTDHVRGKSKNTKR